MSHLCRSGECIYLTFRLCDYMGSSGWSPGLWWGPNSPGNPGLIRLCSMSPCYFRNSDNRQSHKHNQREGDWHLAMPWVMPKCSSSVSMKAAATVEDGPTTGISNLGGYDEVVLTKNTEIIDAFSSRVITTKINIAHTGERTNVMTQALCVEDSSLPQSLMVQMLIPSWERGAKMSLW